VGVRHCESEGGSDSHCYHTVTSDPTTVGAIMRDASFFLTGFSKEIAFRGEILLGNPDLDSQREFPVETVRSLLQQTK